MQILMARGGIAATNCYLIADEASSQAVLFDAPDNTVGPLLDRAKERGWNVIGLWLTHAHFDHMADHVAVREAFPQAKVLVHKLDEPLLDEPNSFFPLPIMIPPGKADGYVEDGQELAIGKLKVQVIHTPGHAPGHVCYYIPEEKLLVGGDLIICGAVGRTDFPGCNVDDLNASIRRIMTLPVETQILPGHCDPSTLEHEAQTNEYVQAAIES
jgi:glyoxylase-like metal-dependent hydrolase (beta-lactamase superfamily II)